MKKNKYVKQYGVDLENEYKEIQLKLENLEVKIRKRALLLFNKNMWNKESIEKIHVLDLLHSIKRIEEDYVSKSKQLELFENK